MDIFRGNSGPKELGDERNSARDQLGTGTTYWTPDPVGSMRLATPQDGSLMYRQDYIPFGDNSISTNGVLLGRTTYGSGYGIDETEYQRLFAGKEKMMWAQRYDFGARYYSARQGRFLSPDEPLADQWPDDPQSWNLYGYARNNPLRYVDPTGRTCRTAADGTVYDDLDEQGCAAVDDANRTTNRALR